MEELLLRRENETELDYHKRLVFGKLIDKTLSDEDYVELSKYVFGKEYSSDVARRMMYGSKYTLQLLDQKQIEDLPSNKLDELEEKIKELRIERKKLNITKNEYNKNFNKDVARQLLYENIKDRKDFIPLPNFKPIEQDNSSIKNEHVLAWSDLHYGADFVSENNSYSREECKRRFEVLVGRAIEIIKMNKISKLHILGLGDDVQGILRLTDIRLNDTTVVESVVEISRLIALVLNELSKHTEVVYYHTMASNHTQTRPITGKPDLIKEDLQIIIGNWIKDLTEQNNRVEVVLSEKDYHSIEICGQNILLLHGHQVKNIKTVVKDYSALHRKFYDIVFLGHFHGGNQFSSGESDNGNIETVIVPSFVGSCPYSDSLAVGSKAMAKYYRIEEGHGIVEQRTIVLN